MFNYTDIKKDLSLYRDQFDRLREEILARLEKHIYRYDRYNQEFSALLVFSENVAIEKELCDAFIRKSDEVYALSQNLMLVMFDVADSPAGLKAAQNFQYSFLQHDVHREFFFALAPIHQVDTAIDIASRLLIILDYALSEQLCNTIVELETMRHI